MENKILATEARALADTTTKVLYRIYKCIKEAASEGRTYVDWDLWRVSETLQKVIIKDLEDAGYKTNTKTYETEDGIATCSLEITW